jgi:hypothetical protein
MTSRLNRVQIDVEGELVQIDWDERDRMLAKLRAIAGSGAIVAAFEAVGASRPVTLPNDQRITLRVMLEVWEGIDELPEGLARLLAALTRADPHSSSRAFETEQ